MIKKTWLFSASIAVLLLVMKSALADFSGYYALSYSNFGNWQGDAASMSPRSNHARVEIISTSVDNPLTISAQKSGVVSASLSYVQRGSSGAGYIHNGNRHAISQTQDVQFAVNAGDTFGFYIGASQTPASPTNPPGTLAITNFTPPLPQYTIGGTLRNLPAKTTVVLQNNGGDKLTLSQNGTFTFPNSVPDGSGYNVTVSSNPVNYVCTASQATGTASANVTSVQVNCTRPAYTIGGSISGMPAGTSVVLLNNGSDNLVLAKNGSFQFSKPLLSGETYDVSVASSPANDACTANSNHGSATRNITDVRIACAPLQYTIGGTLTGLPSGSMVVLQDNGNDTLSLQENGHFTFRTTLPAGANYAVSVRSTPANYVCATTNDSGTVTANVVDVLVSCTRPSYSISGVLTGLPSGSSIVLQNNGGDNLILQNNGPFRFSVPLLRGSPYAVSILSSPDNYACKANNNSGNIASNINNINVTCNPLLTTTYSFPPGNKGLAGRHPNAPLVKDNRGYLWGTTPVGGSNNAGTVFTVAPGSGLVQAYSFDAGEVNQHGSIPEAGLVMDKDGNFYGTTAGGGIYGGGTLFKLDPAGNFRTLYSFPTYFFNEQGSGPMTTLLLAKDGNLYGTTSSGGKFGGGTIFKASTTGQVELLYSFPRQSWKLSDQPSGLIEGENGVFYGTTTYGGDHGTGSVFKFSPLGGYVTLYSFAPLSDNSCKCNADGAYPPRDPLILVNGKFLYGTTGFGGPFGTGAVFRLSLSRDHTPVYFFSPVSAWWKNYDGAYPLGGLSQTPDGSLHGVAYRGGPAGDGVIYKIENPAEEEKLPQFKVEYSFSAKTSDFPYTNTDGAQPSAALLVSDGYLFGVTNYGGMNGNGVIFAYKFH